jgi:tetratricopeptide (TPR) repeat protein
MALIASLSFLGRIDEAEDLWQIAKGRLSAFERARACFALALAGMRISRFKFARRFLRESLEDPECRGLAEVAQGLGVYHFYLGHFPRALKYARRARRRSLQAGDSYIHAFATDLVGHTLVQTGKRSAGIRLLEQARVLAAPGTGEADPFTPERLVYEAEVGIRPATIVEELSAEYAKISETSYTKADLALELARQLTLRGKWEAARALLDEESSAIYSFENRRQEATLQLRLAELSYRRGDAAGALHFLRAARRCLLRIADKFYELQILGLEHKVQRRLLGAEPAVESLARMAELSASHSSPIHRRIQARVNAAIASPELPGEDPLGDFLDSLALNPESACKQLLGTECLGFWPELAGLEFGKISLTLFESGDWVACDARGVWRSRAPLSAQAGAILRRLSHGVVGKEALAREVWRYDYHPLRHDPMIYAALAALRKALGQAAVWLETRDNGWIFHGLRMGSEIGREVAPTGDKAAISPSLDPELNWRQLRALGNFPAVGAWNIGEYRKNFHVSTMTAWRDLDGLVKKRYLLKIGHGRATAYLKGARNL